jgi:iron complex outermembrane receptor protein
VAGKQSSALKGNYSKQQAVEILLADSGLKHTFTGNNSVAVKAKSASEQHADNSIKALATITVRDKAGDDPLSKTYTVTNSSVATKTDTPLMETPMSIQVVPRTVMDDQKATRLSEVLENVSGVRAQQTLGMGNNFIVRGFFSQNIYRNGLKSNDDFPVELDTANLQSVEVLKGPAQLYGRTEPGGLVNLATKKPLDAPYYSLEQRFGSYDLYRTEWDATGPIDKDKTLLYRFTGSYRQVLKLRYSMNGY